MFSNRKRTTTVLDDWPSSSSQWSTNGNGANDGTSSMKNFNRRKFDAANNAKSSSIISIDSRTLRTVVLLAAICAVAYRISLISMTRANNDRLVYVSDYIHGSFQHVWQYASSSENQSKFLPIFCGLGITLLTWIILYLDSNIPGISPPTPFSLKSKYGYRHQRTRGFHLGYITALASGIVVSALMTYN